MPIVGGRLRTRDFDFYRGKGYETSPFLPNGKVTNISVTGRQSTWDRKTNWMVSRRYLAKARQGEKVANLWNLKFGDMGGTFESITNSYESSHPLVRLYSNWINDPDGTKSPYVYTGPLLAATNGTESPSSTLWPKPPGDMLASMLTMGATAIARTIPTHPAAGVGQFLGELREKLPQLPGKTLIRGQGSTAARAADEYLNMEFGIKPIVSDLRDFSNAVKTSNQVLAQLKRDSGRLIRRRYRFPTTVTNELMSTPGQKRFFSPSFHASHYTAGAGPYEWSRQTTTSTWFSAAYSYHYDQGHDLWSKGMAAEQRFHRLFGLRIDPELLWELTPWSWAADWMTNLGDVMTNISAFSRDGLVMRWGYVMQTVVITDTHTISGSLKQLGSTSVTERFTTTVKKRVKATPYGFGLDPGWSDLSTRQLAILSALGITRASG